MCTPSFASVCARADWMNDVCDLLRELKQAGLPVTPREYLTLMEAIEKDLAGRRIEEFYFARW